MQNNSILSFSKQHVQATFPYNAPLWTSKRPSKGHASHWQTDDTPLPCASTGIKPELKLKEGALEQLWGYFRSCKFTQKNNMSWQPGGCALLSHSRSFEKHVCEQMGR